jgi:folate-binding protein YgfZ
MPPLDLHPVAEVIPSPCSVSVLKGDTAIEHLNRTLTVKTSEIQFGDRVDGLLCNANGRILDRLMVCNLGEEILLIGNHGVGGDTRENLIRGIPWNEEITVRNGDGAITHLRLIGRAVNRCLAGLGIDPLEISEERWIEYGSALVSRTEYSESSVIEILVPSAELDAFTALLHENGAISSDRNRCERLRIELGILDHREMNSAFLPLELGLSRMVSLNKGCYPGQEIHARMDSRGKASRGIVRLYLPSDVAVGKHKVPGVGSITVTASAKAFEGSVALAVMPLPAIALEELELREGLIATIQSL